MIHDIEKARTQAGYQYWLHSIFMELSTLFNPTNYCGGCLTMACPIQFFVGPARFWEAVVYKLIKWNKKSKRAYVLSTTGFPPPCLTFTISAQSDKTYAQRSWNCTSLLCGWLRVLEIRPTVAQSASSALQGVNSLPNWALENAFSSIQIILRWIISQKSDTKRCSKSRWMLAA